jgi:protein O-GlcNAc transferase
LKGKRIPPRPIGRAVEPEAFRQGVQAHRAGRLEEAEQLYRKALKLNPSLSAALSNLGIILSRTGRFDEAVSLLERAVETDPNGPNGWINLCNTYRELRRWADAIRAGQRAIELAPTDANALSNLGFALFNADRFDEARTVLERALASNPKHANAWNNLGIVLQRQCQIEQAIACYERTLEIEPGHVTAHSNILFCMHFAPQYTPEEIARAHREWAARHEQPRLSKALPPRAVDPSAAVLRVGMVSADLRKHPVADFLLPLIRNWPKHRLALYFYSTSTTKDDTSLWFAAQASGWRDVAGLSDEQLARQIRADGIDVLFDLTGHTAGHRLLAFALRPAPVQAIWLGYFDTSGMSSMDFIVADNVCVQSGEDSRYSERVVALPHDFVCYEPPANAPYVGPLPALQHGGRVTFGSQNQLVKVTDDVIRLWARVVREVPGSRLLLAGKAFNDESTRKNFMAKFAAEGLEGERLVLRPGNTKLGVLQTYNEIDIALDPFPCAGGTTTCESLWMGVPVVSLFGERFGGRHSAAHLKAVGLPEMVVADEQAYVSLCRSLAADLANLAKLRSDLRERMRGSALCDGKAFAAYFLQAVETMWRLKIGPQADANDRATLDAWNRQSTVTTRRLG